MRALTKEDVHTVVIKGWERPAMLRMAVLCGVKEVIYRILTPPAAAPAWAADARQNGSSLQRCSSAYILGLTVVIGVTGAFLSAQSSLPVLTSDTNDAFVTTVSSVSPNNYIADWTGTVLLMLTDSQILYIIWLQSEIAFYWSVDFRFYQGFVEFGKISAEHMKQLYFVAANLNLKCSSTHFLQFFCLRKKKKKQTSQQDIQHATEIFACTAPCCKSTAITLGSSNKYKWKMAAPQSKPLPINNKTETMNGNKLFI